MAKEGQVVICINDKDLYGGVPGETPPLRKGNKYVIHGIRKCICGQVEFDVGLSLNPSDEYIACRCGHETHNTPIWWVEAERFAEISASQEHAEAVERLKKQEVFEN